MNQHVLKSARILNFNRVKWRVVESHCHGLQQVVFGKKYIDYDYDYAGGVSPHSSRYSSGNLARNSNDV
jgi:hypothetical protein